MKAFLKAAQKFVGTASRAQLQNAATEIERLLDGDSLTPENRRLAETGLAMLREELATRKG